LAGRRYADEDNLTFALNDSFCPWNTGMYKLSGGPDGAHCERTDGSADLRMEVADLSAVYLGGVAFAQLAAAGRVEEYTPGALRRADRMFRWTPAPWCASVF